MKSIEIETERLLLKPLGSEYLETVNAYAMDYENTKYMCRLPNESVEETVTFLAGVDAEWAKEEPAFYEFAILYHNEHIGAVGIYFENGIGELAWIINKKYWRNGFAYEAAQALVSYFTEHMGTTHFIARCDTENVASYKVMEKLGMTRTGKYGGRRNRAAAEDSFEYQYELSLFYRSKLEIVEINQQNLIHINQPNQPFEIIGKIKPVFADEKWTYTEEIFEQPEMKSYPDDTWDYDSYINNPDKMIFLAFSDRECVGQIVLKRDWNRYAFIEDICVAKRSRGKGIGAALIRKAVEWAKSAGLKGLALETQDNNLLACRFYAKCGFVIGAVNTMLYRNFDNEEFAVFWYLLF